MKLKELVSGNGLVALIVLWFILVFCMGVSAASAGDVPHRLYQTYGGYIKGYAEYSSRQRCIDTAFKLKLKPGTWQCLPK